VCRALHACLLSQEETPCSICGHVIVPASKGQHESCMPATIVPGYLYLGSYDTASRQDLLKAMGITHVLNVSASAWIQALHSCSAQVHSSNNNTDWSLHHPCCLQTVPSCPALYRNTFNYHTVSKNPPDFEECFGFLGKLPACQHDRLHVRLSAEDQCLEAAFLVWLSLCLVVVVVVVQMRCMGSSRRCWCTA